MLSGTAAQRPWRYFSAIRALLIGLLLINGLVLVRYGTVSEAIDHVAWLVLLLSYEIEAATRTGNVLRRALDTVRALAGCAVLVAAVGYSREGDWLDMVNAWLWIAVVAMLEAEVRYPERCRKYRSAHLALAASLYGALALTTVLWLLTGSWFDGYDGLLWLLAFGLIELNLVRDSAQ